MSDRPKNPKRVAAMSARMADPEKRAKALANLRKGQAALKAKRDAKKIAAGGPPPAGDPPRKTQDAPPQSATTRRAVGVGRWRGV